jgi:general secretion pathway protein D
VNFLISQAIIESGEEPIFDLITPPRPALDQIELLLSLSLPPLKYKIQNGVVTVLSEEEPLGDYILDVYDIRDLSKLVQNFPAKEFNLQPSEAPEPFFEEEAEPVPDVIAAEELITLIQENIEPISWDNAENTISAIGHFLVVRQSKSVHEKINQLLNDLRASAGILVNIETRFISVDDNFLEDIGVDFRGLDGNIGDDANPEAAVPNVLLDDFGDGSVPQGYGSESDPSGIGTGNDAGFYYDDGEDGDIIGRLENLLDIELGDRDIVTPAGGTTVQFTFLDDVALEAILRAVSKSSTSNIIQAPSLSVYNGERANITVLQHVTYVKDFEPEIAQSSVIAEPVVAVARDGVILDVRPVVSSDHRFITMELRPTVAILKKDEDGDLPSFTTGLGVGESVTIELPELQVKRLRTTVTMPDGATLLLGGMKIFAETKFDSGLPFFKHIPIVSFFLSRKAQYNSKRKLLILVTANIVIPEEREPKLGLKS